MVRVDLVVYNGFSLLEAFGPLQLLAARPDRFSVRLLAATGMAPATAPATVTSEQGVTVQTEALLGQVAARATPASSATAAAPAPAPTSTPRGGAPTTSAAAILVPGGAGAADAVADRHFCDAKYLLSVGSGAALLAVAGLLGWWRHPSGLVRGAVNHTLWCQNGECAVGCLGFSRGARRN